MPTSTAARQHQQDRAQQAATTAAAVGQLWGEVDSDNVEASWMDRLGAAVSVVSGGQRMAAGSAEPWIAQELGVPEPGRLAPGAFAGHASDGRSLSNLLLSPVFTALAAIGKGADPQDAVTAGAGSLDMLTRTQVADAGRAADSVSMTAMPGVAGHMRVVSLPACSRCIVLSGRLYRWSSGFQRHPRCDCTMQPVTSDEWHEQAPAHDPRELFDQMTPAQQKKAFTEDSAQAIEDGADISQVVNARRGMSTAAGTTKEGVTRRGVAGARLITGDPAAYTAPRTGGDTRVVSEFTRRTSKGRQQTVRLRGARQERLMPETIYRTAGSRDEAIEMLRMHGYILK